MHNTWVVFKRELGSYFTTPIAYVFLVIFLFLNGIFGFYIGHFLQRNQADLMSFFSLHPWLYLVLVPAVSMRLWAEERRIGSVELLLTLPMSIGEAVVGKFLAAWAFTGIALALTFPMWITVNYLGNPDNGAIVTSYIGSFLVAGGFLAIGSCLSALTKNQVIAFVLSVVVCLLFLLSGYPVVLDFFKDWAPAAVVSGISSFSVLSHYSSITRGVVDLPDLIYFAALIAFWLFASAVTVDNKKAD